MRHYEIVFFVHPDQSAQVPSMVERYKKMVTDAGGQVHRHEDWGRRRLAYPVAKIHKAHYILLNIECDQKVLADIQYSFRFNDAILRNLVIAMPEAVTEPSPMIRKLEEEQKAQEEEAKALQEQPADDSDKDAAASESVAETESEELFEEEPEEDSEKTAELDEADQKKETESAELVEADETKEGEAAELTEPADEAQPSEQSESEK